MEQQPTTQKSYFLERMELYGITDANNTVNLWVYDNDSQANALQAHQIFSYTVKGIKIIPYGLDRMKFKADKSDGSRFKTDYAITRLETPYIKKDGTAQKYDIPKGAGTPPYFAPSLLEKYEAKTPIKTLYVTEGYFKAHKSCMSGLDCVGLVSITTMVDKETGKLHGDILKLIDVCKVQRVVWLVDADCMDISKEAINTKTDLYNRPYNFYNTAHKFSELLSGIEGIKVFFAHVSTGIEGSPKGLDDIFIMNPNKTEDIIKDALQFDTFNNGKYDGNYFVKFNITVDAGKVRTYFMLHDVTQFYLYHCEKRADLKGAKFKFHGTIFKYNTEKGICEIEVPKEASDYFRVATNYYHFGRIPRSNGTKESTYIATTKSTIIDDNGKDILRHISKYYDFCNIPSHTNYQRVIDGCFNVYFPFEHDPEDGECTHTINFLKHIFGTTKIFNPDTNSEIESYEMGLDYITILYKYPTQVLPILSLVSKERQTGKTTFGNWLNDIFTNNMVVLGNQDLESGFNSFWINKLIVAIDETKIEKGEVIERVKGLSTGKSAIKVGKGVDGKKSDVFLKFIFLSNNEEDLVKIDKAENRFWVFKVPSMDVIDKNLDEKLRDEIPAFLAYINKRKIVTSNIERHWFRTEMLQSEMLDKIKENSSSYVWKHLQSSIKDMFEDFGLETIRLPYAIICKLFFGGKYIDKDSNYFKKEFEKHGYKRLEQQRGTYPVYKLEYNKKSEAEMNIVLEPWNGRPFEFLRKDFTDMPATKQTHPVIDLFNQDEQTF